MKGFCVWFTGLSGSGKSTLARVLADRLEERGHSVQVLDGDEVRQRLTKGLGFSKEDREENISRIAFVANAIVKAGGVAITCAISPYRESREKARAEIGRFIEVYVATPLQECIKRDVKGLYKKALAGEIANFTGVSDPYEPPLNPEVTIPTQTLSVDQSLDLIVAKLRDLKYIT
jgi:adenylyl-sulfate kinase